MYAYMYICIYEYRDMCIYMYVKMSNQPCSKKLPMAMTHPRGAGASHRSVDHLLNSEDLSSL